ncbi:MAG: hypothetical protein QOF73_3861 [Thermomicrobiales bacterium]|jgi:hypothetical protein|nr:hypothetical protein [Thermomicrobiales bacterium]
MFLDDVGLFQMDDKVEDVAAMLHPGLQILAGGAQVAMPILEPPQTGREAVGASSA